MTVEVPVCAQMLQSDLLSALHGFSSHAEVLVIRSLHRPVAVDVLLHIGPRHGLLAGPGTVLDVVAVEPHLVIAVHQLDHTTARHCLGLGAGLGGADNQQDQQAE